MPGATAGNLQIGGVENDPVMEPIRLAVSCFFVSCNGIHARSRADRRDRNLDSDAARRIHIESVTLK